jgi:elongator complex protein 2
MIDLNLNLHKGPQELVGALDSSRRPFDGELAGITLWPETEKLFGHGYEVVAYTYLPWFLG